MPVQLVTILVKVCLLILSTQTSYMKTTNSKLSVLLFRNWEEHILLILVSRLELWVWVYGHQICSHGFCGVWIIHKGTLFKTKQQQQEKQKILQLISIII